jgi:hypothetical protein
MEPELRRCDLVMIDTNHRNPVHWDLFAILENGTEVIRRLQMPGNGLDHVGIIANNPPAHYDAIRLEMK